MQTAFETKPHNFSCIIYTISCKEHVVAVVMELYELFHLLRDVTFEYKN